MTYYYKLKKQLEFWFFQKRFHKTFVFYTSEDEKELSEIYRLRYEVYCEEYNYLKKENYLNKEESDEYDNESTHFILRDRKNEVVASVRLIMNSSLGFPIEKHFKIDLHVPVYNRDNLAEISRLIVSKKYRKKFLLLALLKGIYAVVRHRHVTHVYAVLDEKLYPVLLNIGFPFKKIGPQSVYQGLTSPYIMDVSEMLEELKKKNYLLYRYINNGVLSPGSRETIYAIH